MKKLHRSLKANRSGQLLIVAALAIALLISSTMVYVYEISEETGASDVESIGAFVLAVKQSTRNTVISSLANVSNGGQKTVLATNLNELSGVIRNTHGYGVCNLVFTTLNDSSYDQGTWLSWNTTNVGVSSASANFTLNVDGAASKIVVDYRINATTTLVVNGSYVVEGAEKLVNLTCNTYNEDQPALAENTTVFYESSGNWVQVAQSSLITTDFGNGTYSLSLSVPSDTVQVSVHVVDSRGVLVQAMYSTP